MDGPRLGKKIEGANTEKGKRSEIDVELRYGVSN